MSESTSTITAAAIEDFVIGQITAMGVETSAISADATLVAMGLDSLDVVELSQAVKKHLLVQITPKDFENATTLSEAVSVIRERADAS